MFTDLPERSQGPAVLLQLGGMAREIAMEMNPADIQNGALVDWEDGNGPILTSGLYILIYTLSKRFADLAVESSISAIQNLWNFSRRGGEAIDQILSRFEVTKKRANDQGNFQMGLSGEAWILLRALHIHPNSWTQFLAPCGGTLPTTDQQYREMLTLIRRTYHLHEPRGLAAAGTAGMRGAHLAYAPDPASGDQFLSDPFTGASFPTSSGPVAFDYPAMVTPQAAYPSPSTDQCYLSCESCRAVYYDHDNNSTDTSEGEYDEERRQQLFLGAPRDAHGNPDGGELFEQYLLAKRRWRTFAKRQPRRFRYGKGNKGTKGRGRGRRGQRFMRKSGWSFMSDGGEQPLCPMCSGQPDPAFGEDYFGKGTKGKSKGNPRGPSGPLKCDNCGSVDHLWRRCDAANAEEYRRQRMAQLSRSHFGASGDSPTLSLPTGQPQSVNLLQSTGGIPSSFVRPLAQQNLLSQPATVLAPPVSPVNLGDSLSIRQAFPSFNFFSSQYDQSHAWYVQGLDDEVSVGKDQIADANRHRATNSTVVVEEIEQDEVGTDQVTQHASDMQLRTISHGSFVSVASFAGGNKQNQLNKIRAH